MNPDLIVYFAQILTGIATLIVAFVLLYQLKLQQSEAQRELVLTINQQRQDLAHAVANNP